MIEQQAICLHCIRVFSLKEKIIWIIKHSFLQKIHLRSYILNFPIIDNIINHGGEWGAKKK